MSSSDSEDENLKNFAASVDTTVFSDKLYNKSPAEKVEPRVEMKSQRFLDAEENIFQSEINVSSTMQQFIGNKLSKLIEDQTEFIETKQSGHIEAETDGVVDNVRLLSDAKDIVKYIDEPNFIENRQKPRIKRRNADQEKIADSEKIQVSALCVEDINEEVKNWDKKPKHKAYEYKNIKGVGYLREPTNDFTKARNKNNWSEAKIKNAKFHNPPLYEKIKR